MNRDFRLFWIGEASSGFGSAMTAVAAPLIAVHFLDASPFEVGLLSASVVLPMFLFGVVIATWADGLRYKRPFLIGADLLAASGTISLGVLLLLGRLNVPLLIAGLFVIGVVRTFIETVYFVHLRGIVGDDQLVQARARLEAGDQVGSVTGRAGVGPLVSWVSVAAPLLVDAATHLLNALCLRMLRTAETPAVPSASARAPFGRRMAEGFTEIRRQPFLRGLMPYLLLAQLAAGAVVALTAPFLLRELGIPVAAYGLLFALLGVAGTIGALVGSALAKREVDPRNMVLWGFGLGALPVVVLATAGGPTPLAAVMAAIGIGTPMVFSTIANVGMTGYATRVVPQEVLGRTAMTMQVANTLPLIVGALLGGLLGGAIGIRPALAAAAVVALTAVLMLLRLARVMRAGDAGAAPVGDPAPDDRSGAAPASPEDNPAPSADQVDAPASPAGRPEQIERDLSPVGGDR